MNYRNLFLAFILLNFLLPKFVFSQVQFPNPGHEGLNTKDIFKYPIDSLNKISVGLWIQSRIMYNYSNIPWTEPYRGNAEYYDFFRQRFRTGLDIKLKNVSRNSAGVYTQFEYQGAWGGSSPNSADPRGLLPINNPYNRLQPRGVRYGFVYYNYKEILDVSVGILPVSDQFGNTLFDSDWDFNVGGISLGGKINNSDYRIAYIRYLDGIGTNQQTLYNNINFYLADYNLSLSKSVKIGAHFYYLDLKQDNDSLIFISTKAENWKVGVQMWYGLSINTQISKDVDFNGFIIANSGEINNFRHLGIATKAEIVANIYHAKVSFNTIYTSGDNNNQVANRFVTPHELFRTSGFWGYGHIFSANGPSDVNDLRLEIGNRGAGLLTAQTKVSIPLIKKMDMQLSAAWYKSAKSRNYGKEMGTETAAMFTYKITKFLLIDFGLAYASIGNYYALQSDNLLEVFSRFQLSW